MKFRIRICGFVLALVGLAVHPANSSLVGHHGAVAQEAEGDLDCEDFETQEEAQATLEEDPGDPNNLDPNGDGVACALLPAESDLDATDRGNADVEAQQEADGGNQSREERRQARQSERQGNQEDGGEEEVALTCDDFATAEEAQAAFEEDPEGLADLDADGNGIACEELLELEPADGEDQGQERRGNRRNQDQDEEPADVDIVIDQPVDPQAPEDIDCVDFDFQEEAQQVLNEDPSDPYNLDPSGDGFACTSLPSSGPVVLQVPRTGSGTAGGAGGNSLAGASLLAMLGALEICRRVVPRRSS